MTFYGSDEKAYSFLVKGGEDLRLDQRIEEIFEVMNSLFVKDPVAAKNELKVNTFQVIPMNKRLGLVEWVNIIKQILSPPFSLLPP